MKSVIKLMLLAWVLAIAPGALVAQDETTTDFACPEGEASLMVAAGDVGDELDVTVEIFDTFTELCPNITVEPFQSPNLSADRLGLYVQFLGTRSSAIDIYQIDVTWPSILGEHMVNFYDYYEPDSETIQQHFDPIIENNTVDGNLIGLPWFTDVGLLYYRTDLLEKYELELPTTWEELEEAAAIIQEGERAEGNDQFWGYVWQGNIGEPTTINALEWQASNNGGVIISPTGEIEVNNAETVEAVERAAAWIDTISPPEVIGFGVENARGVWQAGNAAFMRNWPYAYPLGNADDSPIQGNFDVAPLPAGGEDGVQTGALGGWQLSVSQYSENVDAAVALVEYLTSYEAQKRRTIELGLIPTIEALYEDEEVLEARPYLPTLQEALTNATPRPSTIAGSRYADVSRLYSDAVQSVLRGEEDARTAMEDLEFDLEDVMAVAAVDLVEQGAQAAQAAEEAAEATEDTEAAEAEGEPTSEAAEVAQADPDPTEAGAEEDPTAVEEEPVTESSEDETASSAENEEAESDSGGLDPIIIIVAVVVIGVLAIGGFVVFGNRNRENS